MLVATAALDLPPSRLRVVPGSWPASLWPEVPAPRDDILSSLLEMFRWQVLREPGSRARTNRPIKGPRQAVPLPSQPTGQDPEFVFSTDGVTSFVRTARTIDLSDLVFAHPRRSFARRHGQHHKPIAQYSRLVGDLVMCESRLERSFVLVSEYTPYAVHVVSQPMTIMFPVGSQIRHHTPDFLILRHGQPPIVVDVKRPEMAVMDTNVRRHRIVSDALAQAGLMHLVWTGVSATVEANLDLFWGAQTDLQRWELFMFLDLTAEITGNSGMTVRELVLALADQFGAGDPFWLTLIRQAIQEHILTTDWDVFFTLNSRVWSS